MLQYLRRIVQEVNLEQALNIIVHRVKETTGADACSVYLTDASARVHVLQATDGLRPEAVGQVRIPLNRGLIGLVNERAEPVNLADASQHARYCFLEETGEQQYRAFLGVPIIQNGKVLGVLALRKREAQTFEDDAVTLVMTLGSQLAGAISHAKTSGELARLQGAGSLPNHFLQGLPASPGIAIGTALVVYPPADLDKTPDRPAQDPDREEAAFRKAVAEVVAELDQFAQRMAETLRAEDRALFEAWRLMLESDTLIDGTIERIRQGSWAPYALREVIREHIRVFEAMEDPYLRERASDVRDLGRRILMHLEHLEAKPAHYPDQTVLVGEEISVMQLASVPRDRLAGIVSVTGSTSSHIAILARGMGVPAAMGVADLPVSRMEGKEIILDGYRGRVYVGPTPAVRDEYQRLLDDDRLLSHEIESQRNLPSETPDGYSLPLFLNTGLVSESRPLGIEESAGVGLYRTELPFLVRDRFPGEREQMENYRHVLEIFHPRPVTIRTLDIGGDKPLPYFPLSESESNPFLGWRGIRITLDHPEIFLTQVRAALRANLDLGNLQLLLPMISSVREVDEARRLIRRAYNELREEGYSVQMPPVGVMIEVPAAVYQARELARRVDFLSVGTNDLTQYLLAVDRNNVHVARLYDELHPAVLRALEEVMIAARIHGRELSICGEMAGNPLAVPLLMGLGIHSLSMSAGSLLRVKWVVRSLTRTQAREVYSQARDCEDSDCVRRLLLQTLEDIGLAGLVRPGK